MMLHEIGSVSMNCFSASRIREHHMGKQLSGGEPQMLAIGRALSTNSKLLILDEATEGLAPVIREEIWKCLNFLKIQGQASFVIDKFLIELNVLSNRIFSIEKGEVK